MDNNRLIFINRVGKSFMGNHIYEFLFSDEPPIVFDVEMWDRCGYGTSPKNCVKAVYKLESEIDLDLVQENDAFCVNDAISGIIALGWDKNTSGGLDRLYFSFGEEHESIKQKLYKKDNSIQKTYEHE